MTNQYLLEIGTEELPAGFLLGAPAELGEKTRQALSEHELPFDDVQVLVTPRRMALLITGLPEVQAAREQLLKGPPVRIGLNDKGEPTPAAIGFAKKSGIDVSSLKPQIIDGESYLTCLQKIEGRAVQTLLAELLPKVVLSLSGSHFMRWANHEVKFSRPIRWLLSLWNEQHLPLSIGPVSSGTISYGHRVLSDGPIEINSVSAYADTLEAKGAVIVDQGVRKERIQSALAEAAASLKGVVVENEDLLDTVTMLVEFPSVVTGAFQERFLSVPDEVTTTVMAVHQKYFPVKNQAGDLLPRFLTVSNGKKSSAETIRLGNEKVITARFEDARFFFEEDQKIPLAQRIEALKGVTFQKGMGTMYDKTKRLTHLAGIIAKAMGLSGQAISDTERAAQLLKADLVSGMVFEFTELQGVMGQKYAKLQNEPEAVASAIFEHYLPRFNGDAVAKTPVGIATSLADKMDTLVCVFAQENAKLPTGSKDPMGLRRMALGMIETVFQNRLPIDILALLKAAYVGLGSLATLEEKQALSKLSDFMTQRLKVKWLEENIRHDVIDAVLGAVSVQNPLENLLDARERLSVLGALIPNESQLKAIYEPANRIGKILGEKYQDCVLLSDVDVARFVSPTEKALLSALEAVVQASAYPALVLALETLQGPVEQFFEAVLINDPDEAIRKNRYNLLSVTQTQYLRIANFGKLVVS